MDNNILTAFRPRDIGVFNLGLNILPVESKNNYSIYYSIFSFIDKLKMKL